MDLVDLITEKRFLGQEFLTWLWWKSEERGGSISLPERGEIHVVFEKHMLLEYGEGDYNERLVCSGLQAQMKEARTGLRTGKKLEQARVQIVQDAYEWQVTLGATFLEFRNVRLPKTEASVERTSHSAEETEGLVLERIYLFEMLVKIVHELFRLFLEIRVDEVQWETELRAIRVWVHKSADSV